MKVVAIDNTGYKVKVIRADDSDYGLKELPKGIFHFTEPVEIKVDEKKQPIK
tara:strand:+ start:3716 stop:3871 length:156 start_codon:yes stop_codon:yes gene_type:complete